MPSPSSSNGYLSSVVPVTEIVDGVTDVCASVGGLVGRVVSTRNAVYLDTERCTTMARYIWRGGIRM